MYIAVYGKKAVASTIKLGVMQLEAMRCLAKYPAGLTDDELRVVINKPRNRSPIDRMMHGLIKRGFVEWSTADTVVYTVTPKGHRYLQEVSQKKG